MEYEGIVYRPPSEARSLIIQATIGCAHNTCTFCSMYRDKRFHIRHMDEIMRDLEESAQLYGNDVRRVFLADGDALVMKTADLLEILGSVRRLFPHLERVASYGTTQDILMKSEAELSALMSAGLQMVYMGAETGDDEILQNIRKGVSRAEMIEAGQKLKRCGLKSSITLISGLGGKTRIKEHALSCASFITEVNPDYASFLTLNLIEGTPMYEDVKAGRFERISAGEAVEELRLFLGHVDSPGTIFRTNHVSNYVNLAGTLNQDIPSMQKQLDAAEKSHAYQNIHDGFI